MNSAEPALPEPGVESWAQDRKRQGPEPLMWLLVNISSSEVPEALPLGLQVLAGIQLGLPSSDFLGKGTVPFLEGSTPSQSHQDRAARALAGLPHGVSLVLLRLLPLKLDLGSTHIHTSFTKSS